MYPSWVNTPRMVICTGGQSGVDRAALDVALRLGIPYQGWCPAGGWAEDLPEPPGLLALYPRLRATEESKPRYRTIRNVEASDVVLTLTRQDAISPGTDVGVDRANDLGLRETTILVGQADTKEQLQAFFQGLPWGSVVAIGGPRASEAPGIYEQVVELLTATLPARPY